MAMTLLLGVGAASTAASNGIVLRNRELSSESAAKEVFTSASPLSHTVHEESGWTVRVTLDREGRSAMGVGSRWRSGEKLNGFVNVDSTHLGTTPKRRITSVIVRAFWTSTTHFTSYRVAPIINPPTKSLLKKIIQPAVPGPRYEAIPEVRLEWHRAFLPGGGEELYHEGELAEIRREIEGDFPLLDDDVPSPSSSSPPLHEGITPETHHLSLPFSFTLPTSTRVTSSNRSTQAPGSRRGLQNFRRTPPPSLDSSSTDCDGTIEWTVEALIRFEDEDLDPDSLEPSPPSTPMEELPSFLNATRRSSPQTNESGLLVSSPNLAIHRIIFPFEPNDHHAQDLYSTWRPTCSGTWARVISKINGIPLEEIEDDTPVDGVTVPTFNRDARDEAIGGSYMGPRRKIQGGLVDTEGGRLLWSTYEKRMAIQSLIGRAGGWIRSEVSIPFPAMITRHSRALPILIHVAFVPPLNSSPSFLTKAKPIFVDKALIVLSRRTMTRGGKQERAFHHLEEIRRQEVKLWDEDLARSRTAMSDGRSFSRKGEYEGGRKHLCLHPGQKGKDIKIEFDLQAPGVTPTGKDFSALKDCPLSLRTPNIEKEYIISVTLVLSGSTFFFSLRAPIQVTAGDFDDLPQFEPIVVPLPIPSSTSIAMPHPEADLPSYGSL